ncbi:MAG: type IX secretion system sortase PorU [Paramuribaculum sp.]|nr:type IX secretion system sortase PorU [Paramuribaculum sp.]
MSFLEMSAFSKDFYTDNSVLKSGRWLKISVRETGIHFISNETLKKWGFNSLDKVEIYGYGGKALSDILSKDNFIDDLPPVQLFKTDSGVYFFATGPLNLTLNDAGLYERKVNPYSSLGFYFITENNDANNANDLIPDGLAVKSSEASDCFMQAQLHEIEEVNYGSTGRVFFGEDFRLLPSRTFSFNLPGLVKDYPIKISCSFGTRTTSDSYLTLSVNGSSLTNGSRLTIPPTTGSNYGVLKCFELNHLVSSEKIDLGLSFVGGGIVKSANLDYLLINYLSKIEVPARGSLIFDSDSPAISISDGVGLSHVWDITEDRQIREVNSLSENKIISWIAGSPGRKRYVVWSEKSVLPQPEAVGIVTNQNLHDESLKPEMVIFCGSSLVRCAEEIAEIHRNLDNLDVLIVEQGKVFNEFASGARDPNAFRKFLKMIYDREPERLKYALFLGRGSFDNRNLTSNSEYQNDIRMPIWESEESMTETISYTSDDIFAQLDDNAGIRPESDRYNIAIGRIPAKSVVEAESYIVKLKQYLTQNNDGEWTKRIVMLADDGDLGIHLSQAENEINSFSSTETGMNMLYEKIYIDSYSLQGGNCEEARSNLLKQLDKGVVWFNYNGHANKYYLTGQGVFTLNDINNLRNKRLPVFFGATCYFMQWDNNDQSGAEKLLFNPDGGIIAGMTATRPVFISENAFLASKMAEEAFKTDQNGKIQSLGISFINAKNQLSSPVGQSNSNKLRYGFMGDPAITPAGSLNRVTLDSIDNVEFKPEEEVILQGLSEYKFSGRITDKDGETLKDFNGRMNLSFYDADKSITTIGRDIDGTKGRQMTYDKHGDLLFVASDSVLNGCWTMKVILPEDIADNFRPTTIQLSAVTEGNSANGLIRSIYVCGLGESLQADTIPPVIESIYLNDISFKSGDRVNPTPVLFVKVSDNSGINLSTSGIGRNMSVTIDNKFTIDDVTMYYTPKIGESGCGEIIYPLPELTEGEHILKFRVADIAGNVSEKEIFFIVDENLAPEITDIYTDANPASTDVNFYLVHNRPDAIMTITVSVYSLQGNMVWSSTVTNRSDLLVSSPISWNLLDRGGRRVSRGIYIYRAEIICNGKRVLSPARRLAVTGK